MQPLNYKLDQSGILPKIGRMQCADRIKSLAGKHIKIKIWEAEDEASESQREYYFAVIVPAFMRHFAAEDKCFDKTQMHDSMMRAIGGFSNPYVNPFTGEPDSGRKSYTALTKKQVEGYHTLCRQWAAEHDFDIPEPNETNQHQP